MSTLKPAALAASLLLTALSASAQEKVDTAAIARIKAEAMSRSQVMEIASWMTDVHGPRLTWSPNLLRAGEWAMAEMRKWGLQNVHAERWDTPVGLGWENQKFSFNATSPQSFIVQAVPQAWSGSTNGTVTGRAMAIRVSCLDELKAQYSGKLKNAFVMFTPALNRPVNLFAATANRQTDSSLSVMAAAQPAAPGGGGGGRGGRGGGTPATLSAACEAQYVRDSAAVVSRAARSGNPTFVVPGRSANFSVTDTNNTRWLSQQGIGAILLVDAGRAGGVISTNNGASRVKGAPRVASVHVAQESYGRIARMIEKNQPVMLTMTMQNKFYPENTSAYNYVGEIPGTDPALKDEVVMIGAHFDSWHAATGATDNAAGSSIMMEAMRLLKTLDLKPRRTIRIALWTGEEQGLLGSRAYARSHFGYADSLGFHPTPEHGKLSAYFNVDNGGGKIRGIYLQGIEGNRPIFDAWMEPFKANGMKTVTINNTGGTDHLAYIGVGLPGFQFIQDPLDYGTQTHHTNQDVFERLQPDDMKWNSAVLAAFAWQAAQRDEKLPRPPMPGATGGRGGRGGLTP